MSYTIKNTDGTTLLVLSDSKVDEVSTSLTLIGKNYESYGQYYNNNLVRMLENFASSNEPRSPLTGQLWFNKIDGRVYVYGNDKIFTPITGAIVSASQPTLFKKGDFWIDSANNQLYFSSNGLSFTLAGPTVSSQVGKNGWYVDSVLDDRNIPRLIASVFANDTLLGIVSSTAFTLLSTYNNYGIMTVQPGFNLNPAIPNVKFIGTATNAEMVAGYSPSSYLVRGTNEITTGTFSFLNNAGVSVGAGQDIAIYVDSTSTPVSVISNEVTNGLFELRGVNGSIGRFPILHVDSNNKRLGIFKSNPSYTLDIVGDTQITGDLFVNGATTYLHSNNLQVTDKNIYLAYTTTSYDSLADGGGIVLKGDTDHTLLWTIAGGWAFNQGLNLSVSTATYKIGGTTVISSSALGSGITTATGLNTVGVLNYLTVTNVVISGSTITTTGSNVTLYLDAAGSGTIDASGNLITNVSTCVARTDAANKGYVDDSIYLVGTKGFTFNIDISSMVNPNTEIIPYLNKLLPVTNAPADAVFDLPNGVRARVLCANSSVTIPANTATVSYSTTLVDQNGVQSAVSVVASVASNALIPARSGVIPTFTYTVKEFKVLGGAWTFIQDIV